MIPLAKWGPDRFGVNAADVAGEALGVLPRAGSYGPWPALAAAVDVLPVTAVITDITQANPGVVTYAGADVFSNGEVVRLSAVSGMTEVNGNDYTIANLDTGANTFQLSGTNTSGFTAYSSGGVITAPNTSSSTCRGAFTARTSGGASVIFAGSATKLYKYSAATHPSYIDVTRTSGGDYALGAGDFWSFAQFDNLLIATNGVDAPQYIDVDSGTAFAALGGSPPTAKFVKVVGDVVLLMQLTSAQGSVAATGEIQCMWSGFRDPDYWTIGKKSCGFATFWNVGFVQGSTNILAGLLFTQKSIQRMVQTTSSQLLAFAPVTEEVGTEAPYSIITRGNTAYLYSTQGFTGASQGGINPIGNEWVDNWFAENANGSRTGTIKGAFDPIKMRVFWLFPTTTNDTDYLDHIICYDIALGQWTHAPVAASYLFASASVGQTLSDLASAYSTLSGVPYPFGSSVWKGGAPGLAAFGSDDKFSFFSGGNLEALAQTGQSQPVPGRRGYVNGWTLVTDAASGVTSRMSAVERLSDAETFTSLGSPNAAGRVTRSISGRYFRGEVAIASGTDWDHLQGIDELDVQEDGED